MAWNDVNVIFGPTNGPEPGLELTQQWIREFGSFRGSPNLVTSLTSGKWLGLLATEWYPKAQYHSFLFETKHTHVSFPRCLAKKNQFFVYLENEI